MQLISLGASGVGKGTQALTLSELKETLAGVNPHEVFSTTAARFLV